ncbi:DNA polymerase Y family protein [Gordonia sp. PDNC005]|uniref:DNA polymerase Y family protein n=1 Tax=Gordonia sp. PDNC005 TaxID=2811424 RepID=UPI001963221C|nr:DNA polymerase Y family protein [Gordonia sp. PDNC005]QRY63432.1 DNA polymerase Y family protein [Gordonia sp. PDNC005]
MDTQSGRRVMAVWCPDWPAVAAASTVGITVAEPIAVLHAGKVVACSRAARTVGVRRGMRKRQAQSLCPDLMVFDADPTRDGRLFEPVVAAVTEVVPLTEVLRPGLLVVTADRAARYFGGEAVLAERIVDAVAAAGVAARVGVADELFTAVLSARSGQSVPPGTDAAYLATRPISDLTVEVALSDPTRPDLVDLLWRLGIRTLGAFAELPVADVASRFSADAVVAHRLASASPGRRPSRAPIPAVLEVEYTCDPPVDRIDSAAFLGRRLAEELHHRLSAASLACTRLTVHAITERGQRHSRTWWCAQPLTPDATADRIRWQLEGWLVGTAGRDAGGAGAPDSPIARLHLEPVEVVDPGSLQHAFVGAGLPAAIGDGLTDRARRALVRVQGLLGGESVRVPIRSGGRGPAEQVALVTLGDEQVPPRDPNAAWPDRLARPSPALLSHTDAELLDAEGDQVAVTPRGGFTTEPAEVRVGRRPYTVCWWAGPWPFGTDAEPTGVSARAQVLLEDSRALLLCYRERAWTVEGVYE